MFASKALCCLLLLAGTEGLQAVDEAGYARLLESRRGKTIVVDFWATWCEPCREEMPVLIALQKKLGFELITVSADEPEQETVALEFLRSISAPLPAWIKRPRNDEKFINDVDPKWSGALPGIFVYDRTGKLRQSFTGEIETFKLEKALRQVLGQAAR